MDILLTKEGDIDLGDNFTMKLCSLEQDLVRQRIFITLKVNKGEWLYDLEYGTPWLENEYNNFSILGKVPITVFNSEIRQQILSREGVAEILTFDTTFDRQTREAITTASVKSTTGEIIRITEIIAS